MGKAGPQPQGGMHTCNRFPYWSYYSDIMTIDVSMVSPYDSVSIQFYKSSYACNGSYL